MKPLGNLYNTTQTKNQDDIVRVKFMNSNPRNTYSEWLVRMKVEGYISIGNKIKLGDVEFVQRKKWIEATARISAVNSDTAEKVALRKVSDLLNILSFISDCSIKLVGVEPTDSSNSAFPTTIRILNANDVQKWRIAEESGDYELLSALGYYRKGLNELDPFDAFQAFWTSVEIVCAESNGNGIGQKIVSFARAHSVEIKETDVNDLKGTRNRIAHGGKRYDIDQIKYVAEKIPRMRNLARQLLEARMAYLQIK